MDSHPIQGVVLNAPSHIMLQKPELSTCTNKPPASFNQLVWTRSLSYSSELTFTMARDTEDLTLKFIPKRAAMWF